MKWEAVQPAGLDVLMKVATLDAWQDSVLTLPVAMRPHWFCAGTAQCSGPAGRPLRNLGCRFGIDRNAALSPLWHTH